MEKGGKIYVNRNTTVGEFMRYNLEKHKGIRPDIDEAIEFFRDRIQGRYLNQIQMLNNHGHDVFDNGFTAMAICCLLIDTFYQFEHGVAQTTQNKVRYTDFLRVHMGDVFDTQEKADRFYTDIRCGILHSAQTKNGSRLSAGALHTVDHITPDLDSPIYVDVQKMADRLFHYFNEYCGRVRYDNTTQSNFVKKLKLMFK